MHLKHYSEKGSLGFTRLPWHKIKLRTPKFQSLSFFPESQPNNWAPAWVSPFPKSQVCFLCVAHWIRRCWYLILYQLSYLLTSHSISVWHLSILFEVLCPSWRAGFLVCSDDTYWPQLDVGPLVKQGSDSAVWSQTSDTSISWQLLKVANSRVTPQTWNRKF